MTGGCGVIYVGTTAAYLFRCGDGSVGGSTV
jgi:hypothetical protein